MGSSVQYNRTLEPYLRSRGRENEVINDFCHAPAFSNFKTKQGLTVKTISSCFYFMRNYFALVT